MIFPPEIQEMFNTVVIVGGFFGACGVIYKTFKSTLESATKPFKNLENDIKSLKEQDVELKQSIEEINKKLNRDDEALRNQETMNEIMMKSLSALLTHSIDGNNISEMEDCRKDIQEHLLDAGSSIR